MTDKEKIKEEIERRISNLEQIGDRKEIEIHFPEQFKFIKMYEGLLQFIDSLPEKPTDETIKKNYYDRYKRIVQTEQFKKSYCDKSLGKEEPLSENLVSEMVSEDLEEAAQEYSFNIPTQLEADSVWRQETEQHFKDGAKWQKEQMKESLQTEYEKGRFDMREEMMKNTVLETKVMTDCDGDGIETPYEEWLTLENTEIPYIPDELGLKEGDKVKIIILKTE